MSNMLVTGGTGNIGMYAVAEFIRRGHDVVVLDRVSASPILQSIAPAARIVQGDILDVEHMSRTVEANAVDHILHLAAFLGPESSSDPIKAVTVNCQGTANVFDVALRHGVKRVCWSSSIAAIGVMPT